MSNNDNNEQIIKWYDDIEDILNRILSNSALLSKYHKKQYYNYKGYLKYFRIPTIVFSAVGSVASVGFKPYLTQDIISITTCFIGLSVGILNSIELFLSIQSTMEKSLSNSKDFYLLSIDIKKILLLERKHRQDEGRDYLEEKYNTYCELIKSSELINKNIEDKLLPLETKGRNIISILNKRNLKNKKKLNNLNEDLDQIKKQIINLENNKDNVEKDKLNEISVEIGNVENNMENIIVENNDSDTTNSITNTSNEELEIV